MLSFSMDSRESLEVQVGAEELFFFGAMGWLSRENLQESMDFPMKYGDFYDLLGGFILLLGFPIKSGLWGFSVTYSLNQSID